MGHVGRGRTNLNLAANPEARAEITAAEKWLSGEASANLLAFQSSVSIYTSAANVNGTQEVIGTVPEPGSIVLMGVGCVFIGLRWGRQRRR